MSLLKKARKEADLSLEELAGKVGTSRQQLSRLEKNPADKDYRKLTKEWAERLAPHLHKKPWELMFSGEFELAPKPLGNARIPILGEVAAGLWLEVEAISQTPDKWLPFSPDDTLPENATFALIVRGDSINKRAPEGALLICVDIYKAEIKIQNGDLAIVERIRPDNTREVTAKRVRKTGKAIDLLPESTNPHWKPVRLEPPDENDETIVRVLAKVIHILTNP